MLPSASVATKSNTKPQSSSCWPRESSRANRDNTMLNPRALCFWCCIGEPSHRSPLLCLGATVLVNCVSSAGIPQYPLRSRPAASATKLERVWCMSFHPLLGLAHAAAAGSLRLVSPDTRHGHHQQPIATLARWCSGGPLFNERSTSLLQCHVICQCF